MTCLMLLALFLNEPKTALSLENLAAAASHRFEEQAGEAWRITANGLALASDQVGGRLSEVALELVSDRGAADNPLNRGETQAAVGVALPLADTPGLKRATLTAETETVRRQGEVAKRDYVLEMQRLLLETLEATRLIEHLEEHARRAAEDYARLEDSYNKELISRLDLLEQKTALGRFQREIAEMQAKRARALGALERHWGGPVTPELPLWDEQWTPPENPWRSLPPEATAAHELAALEAARQTELNRADLAIGENAARLSAKLLWRREADSSNWAGAGVSLSLPLRPRKDAAYHRARAEAAAVDARRRWLERQAQSELAAMIEAYDRSRDRLALLRGEYLGPLEDRVTLLETAWRQGHAPLRQLVAARLEWHEAEHEALATALELWRQTERAKLLAQLTNGTTRRTTP